MQARTGRGVPGVCHSLAFMPLELSRALWSGKIFVIRARERERDKIMRSLDLLSDSLMPQSEIFNTYWADSSLPCNCIRSLSLSNQTAVWLDLYLTLPSFDPTFIWPDLHLTWSSSDPTFIRPDLHLTQPSSDPTFIRPDLHLTRPSSDPTFIWPDLHPTRPSSDPTFIRPDLHLTQPTSDPSYIWPDFRWFFGNFGTNYGKYLGRV
jgi:hypothetical protein